MKTTETAIMTELAAMFPCEFEAWRERGDNERHVLTTAVMQRLTTPAGWRVNGEYRSEFGGLFPVQIRVTSPDAHFHLCICSPGELSATWVVVLISDDGGFAREVMSTETFAPARLNALLAAAERFWHSGCTVQNIAGFLAEEVYE